jgi:hypothetical protein
MVFIKEKSKDSVYNQSDGNLFLDQEKLKETLCLIGR